jgi:osmotically-inducible protein OsmY
MGWLQRLFGMEKPQNPQQAIQGTTAPETATPQAATAATAEIPPERVGLNGEYDQSGLAKRVALAFDEDPEVSDIDTVYVAQTGGTVVLKGKVPNQQILSKLASIARNVNGATSVETDQVAVG